MDNGLLMIAVFVFTLVTTFIIEAKALPLLSGRAKQPIYAEGPTWHMSKSGTPTMGGIAFVISISLALFISAIICHLHNDKVSAINLTITALFALGNSLIGIFDDLTKLKKKENAGLTPKQKLIFQFLFSILFLMARRHFLADGTILHLPFISIDLGIFYYPFAIILLLGIINCANLTDGIDGLASSVALSIGTVYWFIGYSGTIDNTLISLTLIGGTLGFLFFNTHPAKVFMGDTGSLFLGAMAVGLAFTVKCPTSIIPIGAVYVIEGISVILQVIVFKLTKKRLFKMAPLHHHLEKCGMSENMICVISVIVTLISSCLAAMLMR